VIQPDAKRNIAEMQMVKGDYVPRFVCRQEGTCGNGAVYIVIIEIEQLSYLTNCVRSTDKSINSFLIWRSGEGGRWTPDT